MSRINRFVLSPLATFLLILAPGCSRKEPPFAPKDALKTFQIDPAWRIDLFASEPMGWEG